MGTSEGRCARLAAQPGAGAPHSGGGPCNPLVGSVSSQPRQAVFLSQVTFRLTLWGTCYSGSHTIPAEAPSAGESCLCPARVWGPGATVNTLPAPPWGCDGCELSRVALGAGAPSPREAVSCPLGLWMGL